MSCVWVPSSVARRRQAAGSGGASAVGLWGMGDGGRACEKGGVGGGAWASGGRRCDTPGEGSHAGIGVFFGVCVRGASSGAAGPPCPRVPPGFAGAYPTGTRPYPRREGTGARGRVGGDEQGHVAHSPSSFCRPTAREQGVAHNTQTQKDTTVLVAL